MSETQTVIDKSEIVIYLMNKRPKKIIYSMQNDSVRIRFAQSYESYEKLQDLVSDERYKVAVKTESPYGCWAGLGVSIFTMEEFKDTKGWYTLHDSKATGYADCKDIQIQIK